MRTACAVWKPTRCVSRTAKPDMQEMIEAAPRLLDFLGEESQQHFDDLRRLLDSENIAYVVNPRLVRGLDYYTRTVFEWITEELGSQGTVCGGGRYDGLVELFSGKQLPASGLLSGSNGCYC